MNFGLKKIDHFTKNILIVFVANFLSNFFNLVYQLLIAHKLSVFEFASFNSLLSIFMVISAPLSTIQLVMAKYISEFNAHGQSGKISSLISGVLKKIIFFASLTLVIFALSSGFIIDALKIQSVLSGYILAALLAFAWISPVFSGSLQGLEYFGWISFSQITSGIAKIILTIVFLALGYKIAGALGVLLLTGMISLLIAYLPLNKRNTFTECQEKAPYKEILLYLLPVAVANFCYMALVSMDMILVKYYFGQQESGSYSLAQMVGKIFLFLPAAISIVMFPKTSGLKAKNLDTRSTLKKSLIFGVGLCVMANLIYNLFPNICLNVLTGKSYAESISLGRLFGVSMSFFSLLYILISYFLSIKDMSFIKYLGISTSLQVLGIILFHRSLEQVQLIICFNAALLFFVLLSLIYTKTTLTNERP